MTLPARASIAGVVLSCVSGMAAGPISAQTQLPPAGYPPPPGPYAPAPYPAPHGSPYPDYQPQPQPTGPPQMVHRPRKGLLIGGLVTFGVTWGLAAFSSLLLQGTSSCASAACMDGADLLWIPLAGPILAERSNPGGMPIFLMWSLAQVAGATMTIFGLVGHKVPDTGDGPPRVSTWQLLPALTATSQGLLLRATF